MKPEIRFEELIRNQVAEGSNKITVVIDNIETKDNMLYFSIDGHRFQTFGTKIQHEGNVMFDSPPTKIWAKTENDPESIERADQEHKQFNEDFNLWEKYRHDVVLTGFARAFTAYEKTKSKNKFFEKLEEFFDVTPNDSTYKKLHKQGLK